MLKNLTYIFFVFFTLDVTAQKTEIIHQSNFKHDYVLERAEYLEDIKDTVNCKYIATINAIASSKAAGNIGLVDLISIRARSLGANVFYVDSYRFNDSSLAMTVKLLYAFKKVYDRNETKRFKNRIFVFCHTRMPDRYHYFYLNDTLRYLNTQYYEIIDVPVGRKFSIKTCNPSGVTGAIKVRNNGVDLTLKGKTNYRSKPGRDAMFIFLYGLDLFTEQEIKVISKRKILNCGLYRTDYRVGRVILEIAKKQE